FTVTTVKDISHQHALESIRNSIVQNQDYTAINGFPDVVQALKELTGNAQIEFSLLPLFKINGKLVHDRDIYNRSALFSSAQKNKLNDKECFLMVEKFVSTPGLLFFSNLEKEVPAEHTATLVLQEEGIKSYALLPVYYNTKLVGAIEIYSKKKEIINDKVLRLVESAGELLAHLMHNSVTALQMEIEAVIKEKYTSMQPSVQWKFAEVAWQYLQQKKSATNPVIEDIEEIVFRNVFPLYGAVDIRNSTIERNLAMLKDNTIQVEILIKVLNLLKDKTNFGLLEEKIFLTNKWLLLLTDKEQVFNQQVKLNDFLENNISPFLNTFTENNDELKGIAQAYYNAIDEKTGDAFKFRRCLEISMTKVISTVNTYFDQLKEDIQKAYPFYFEKFRTDGVEYDIYIGQSISPDIPYSDIYLKNLRLLQLKSMAAIAKYTDALLPHLPNPVETTQLIFIHSQPIDILFRIDEKRFDVEGAYNIRYHIIKKRIDKVHLRDSDERLTQPGKIALVYFSDTEASEYISYIKYLQADDILKDDLEKLQLEELSGVTGLKALRVSVNLSKNSLTEISENPVTP
ncbi:MAG TPA: GAF domain-containing protein, partial [Ferruginibacter sp.]|nr:GAF domain-containing protein [Ferruginibacter sp.]